MSNLEQRARELHSVLNGAVALLENIPHQHAKSSCPICQNIEEWKKLLAAPAPAPAATMKLRVVLCDKHDAKFQVEWAEDRPSGRVKVNMCIACNYENLAAPVPAQGKRDAKV